MIWLAKIGISMLGMRKYNCSCSAVLLSLLLKNKLSCLFFHLSFPLAFLHAFCLWIYCCVFILALSLTHSLSHTHTHTLIFSLSHTHTLIFSLSLSLSLTHTHSLTILRLKHNYPKMEEPPINCCVLS